MDVQLLNFMITGKPLRATNELVSILTLNLFYNQIGVDIDSATRFYKNTKIKLQIWDISGQERFGNMTRVRKRVLHVYV